MEFQEYRKLLLSEQRRAVYQPGRRKLTDERMVQAMTVNGNLTSLGYTLKPQDVVGLASSRSLETLYEEISDLTGTVDAKPMYPDFPNQVMAIDEAEFRFHQLVHYFSTYGMEWLFGVEVQRGWMPKVQDTEKTEKDTRLLELRVLELIPEKEMFTLPMKQILERRERMSEKDGEIVKEAVKHVPSSFLSGLAVPFKQNLMTLFLYILKEGGEDRLELLHTLLKHTGDVLKCMDYALTKSDYHFRTSEKRLLVKLLESYPSEDFSSNLILSRKKGNRSELVLRFVDYNLYARSEAHKKALKALRDGELRSWEARAKKMLGEKDPGTVAFYAKRPGMLLRAMRWLLREGFPEEEIRDALKANASSLSLQTLTTVYNKLRKALFTEQHEMPDETRPETSETRTAEALRIAEAVLRVRLGILDTPLSGKKVYVDYGEIDAERMTMSGAEKSVAGGYFGAASYAIPEGAKTVRFFVYWNDEKRMDLDLHALAVYNDGHTERVGWNAEFRAENGEVPDSFAVIHSGDITHSDAAEYIDIRLESDLREVVLCLNSYTGDPFSKIRTVFAGVMAVDKMNEEVALYDPANCFFTTDIKTAVTSVKYGTIYVPERSVRFENTPDVYYDNLFSELEGREGMNREPEFSLKEYVDLLLDAQGAVQTESRDTAEIVLVSAHASCEEEISLSDNNFFLDAKTR